MAGGLNKKKREVDVFAGKGSFSDKLKRRRKAYEEGTPEKGPKIMKKKTSKK